MHTVVEVPSYLKAVGAIFTETERADIVSRLASDPECGDLSRVQEDFAKSVSDGEEWEGVAALESFTFRNNNFPIFLVTAYPKN